MKIFVSYASEDREIAWEVATSLRAAGHEVFFDQTDLAAGGEFHAAIQSHIEEADAVVLLLSPSSVVAGRYVAAELDAISKRWPNPAGRVLPVVVRPVETVPGYLRAVGVMQPPGPVAASVVHAFPPARPVRKRWVLVGAGLILLLGAVGLVWWLMGGPWGAKKPEDRTAEEKKAVTGDKVEQTSKGDGNVQVGTIRDAAKVVIHPRPVVVKTHQLNNSGGATMVLKEIKNRENPLFDAVDQANQVGIASVGTEVKIVEGVEEIVATGNPFLRFRQVEIVEGPMKGKVGWVSSGAIHMVEKVR